MAIGTTFRISNYEERKTAPESIAERKNPGSCVANTRPRRKSGASPTARATENKTKWGEAIAGELKDTIAN